MCDWVGFCVVFIGFGVCALLSFTEKMAFLGRMLMLSQLFLFVLLF